MRDLTVEEIEMVSGGGWFSQFMDWAGFDGKFGDGGGSGGFFGAMGSALGGARDWLSSPFGPRGHVEIGPLYSDPEDKLILVTTSDMALTAGAFSVIPPIAQAVTPIAVGYGIADRLGVDTVVVGAKGWEYNGSLAVIP